MVIQDQQETGEFESMKKSCVIYDSWSDLIGNLPDEMAGQLIKMVLGYAFGEGCNYSDNQALNAIFEMMRAKIDDDCSKYYAQVERAKNNSKRGRNDVEPMSNEVEPTSNEVERSQSEIKGVSVYVSDYVSDKDKKEKDKKKNFVKPSLDEVRSYCQERNNNVDPEAFIDFYESKGWKVGNQPMKDWKAAVRTWEKRESKPANKSSPPSEIPQTVYEKIHNYSERTIDYAALGAELLR